jgi:hypothetical protein
MESQTDQKTAWARVSEFIKIRMSMKVPQTGRKWTREELYTTRDKDKSKE